jgi:cytochrome c oxidase cbb3-type subunit III
MCRSKFDVPGLKPANMGAPIRGAKAPLPGLKAGASTLRRLFSQTAPSARLSGRPAPWTAAMRVARSGARVKILGAAVMAVSLAAWGAASAPVMRAQDAQGGAPPGGHGGAAAQGDPTEHMTPAEIESGKLNFQGSCGECHGVDASGGVGPNLHGVVQQHGTQFVFNAIRHGIPGTAMAPVSSLNDKRAWQVVAYLKTLAPEPGSMKVNGDPAKGKELYASNGCSTCHEIDGKGGAVGPELTDIGAMRSPKYLEEVLVDPAKNPPADPALPGRRMWTGYVLTKVVTKDGKTFIGSRVNEDTFTITLRDMAGNYRTFNKSNLQSVDKEFGKSFMPSFSRLSEAQRNDLVAYLMTLKGAQ